ncbi:MAG: CPBP family glutamic-type intramembrane protease [Pseudomonadota bacterium]
MTRALGHPQPYVLGFSVLCVVLVAHARRRAGSWKPATLLWIGYLGALSLWEEWAFRVALPQWLMDQSLPSVGAVVLANALFGGMHYVTLRWRWQLCLGAALGGLLLSRNFAVQQDLLLLGALHWVGTYLNTPHPPSPR